MCHKNGLSKILIKLNFKLLKNEVFKIYYMGNR